MIRIDDFPTHELNGIKYRHGRVQPFGATVVGNDGINFSVFSKDAVFCELLLFHRGEKDPFARIPFPDDFRIGNVFSMIVYGLDIEDLEYGYCMDGSYDPENGYRFDKEKILLDPYAKLVSGRDVWGKEPDPNDPFQHRGRVILDDYDWEGDKPLEIPMKDLVIYEAHVRSFTRDESSGVRYKGTFAGIIDKIPYLKELGINCIELLPIFEFDEFENSRVVEGERLYNYWGYSTVCFFAPKAGYAASAPMGMAADELKNLIKRLHKAGIEVILDVVFNHTAEGNEQGPYISYRGIDNKTYYLLTPDGYYYNFSGCGNTMNCNNAIVRNCILDALRYWVSDYHIDGFRFDLAAILSRDENGAPMTSPPLLETLAHDAVLGKSKLIAEAWDAGGLYQVGSFPAWGRWAEWNGKYRDCLRKFVKSSAECGPELIWRLKGSPDLYGNRSAEASVNFITCHDGFTLYDLVSYNEKHNMANGEENRDGSNDNDSWNCGVEGATDDPEINSLRNRQIKNAAALLLLSRGIPMILSGDEFGNTQFGNNNAYCQDNRISWLDWGSLEENKDIFDFFKTLIEFRSKHPVLRRSDYYTGQNSSGYPELSFHGTRPWDFDENAPFLSFGFMYAEPAADYGTDEDAFIYCAVNAYWEDMTFSFPDIPDGMKWEVVAYSGGGKKAGKDVGAAEGTVKLMPRSLMLLIGHRPKTGKRKVGSTGNK
ncbi:MAG: glycogen debranching protein GlgX [Lachnospiraceae bacterium]|nr:glycogen debranching protein GlgX [Lachnospiraceae bacterium]